MAETEQKQPVWLLDFDGTITTRDSFMPFVFFLAFKTQAWRQLIVVAWYLFLFVIGVSSAQLTKEKILYLFLIGKSEAEVKSWGSEFVELMCAHETTQSSFHTSCAIKLLQRIGLFPPLTFRPFFFEILQKAAEVHGRVIIVSASLDLYLQPLADKFGCELVCTRVQFASDGYQKHFASLNCVKEEKVKGITALLGDLQAYEVQAYGNSSDDFAMLSLVKNHKHAHFNDFGERSWRTQVKQYLKLIRVHQYVKNCFVFIPLFFAGKFFEPDLLGQCFLCFVVFCLVSSFIYILNDIRDLKEDRNHALKRFRPIASGQVAIPEAVILAAGLLLGMSILALSCLPVNACGMVLLYLVLHLSYVYIFKYVALIDIVCVALGFNLRVFAGGFACGLTLSTWLVLMVFLLSMFLVMGKRWDDLARYEQNPHLEIRPALYGYNKEFALSSLTFLSAITSVCYILYCLDNTVQIRFDSRYVYISVLWVIMSNLRYLQNIFVFKDSFSPSKILYKDRILQFCLFAWTVNMLFIVYI